MPNDLSDARLEREIQAAFAAFDAAVGTPQLPAAWRRLQELVCQRSDAQVAKMERDRRLQ